MIFSLIVMIIEFIFCNILSPTVDTSMASVALLLLFVNTIVLIIAVTNTLNKCNNSQFSKMVVIGLILRIILLLWDMYGRDLFILPNGEGDAVGYHKVAISYAFGNRSEIVKLTDYAFFIGRLYRTIGIQKITAQFINVYLSIVSIVLIIQIMDMLKLSEMTKNTVIKVMCFLPNLMIINCLLLQETIVAFFIVASVYAYTIWWKKNNSMFFIFAIALSVIGSFLHIGGMVSAIGILISYPFVKKRKLSLSAPKFFAALGISVVIILLVSTYGSDLLGKVGGDVSVDSIVAHSGQTDRVSDADYLIGDTGMSSTTSFIVLTPVRVLYFICSPLPWMWRGISDLIAFFGSALFFIMTVKKAFLSFKFCSNEEEIKAYMFTIIMILILASIIFAWGVSNTGTALRHREKFAFLCALLYGISIEIEQRRFCYGKVDYGNSSGISR